MKKEWKTQIISAVCISCKWNISAVSETLRCYVKCDCGVCRRQLIFQAVERTAKLWVWLLSFHFLRTSVLTLFGINFNWEQNGDLMTWHKISVKNIYIGHVMLGTFTAWWTRFMTWVELWREKMFIMETNRSFEIRFSRFYRTDKVPGFWPN